jgi:hypothetical protein
MSDAPAFQCCFCGRRIVESSTDPCELIVTSRFGRPEGERRTQAVYAHAACVRERTTSGFPWDALDADE